MNILTHVGLFIAITALIVVAFAVAIGAAVLVVGTWSPSRRNRRKHDELFK